LAAAGGGGWRGGEGGRAAAAAPLIAWVLSQQLPQRLLERQARRPVGVEELFMLLTFSHREHSAVLLLLCKHILELRQRRLTPQHLSTLSRCQATANTPGMCSGCALRMWCPTARFLVLIANTVCAVIASLGILLKCTTASHPAASVDKSAGGATANRHPACVRAVHFGCGAKQHGF
jgi:hypothetical protein